MAAVQRTPYMDSIYYSEVHVSFRSPTTPVLLVQRSFVLPHGAHKLLVHGVVTISISYPLNEEI